MRDDVKPAVQMWMQNNYFFFESLLEMIEECSRQFGHVEWINDEDYWIWDMAEKIARDDLRPKITKLFNKSKYKRIKGVVDKVKEQGDEDVIDS
jgi:hypothetical protein